MAYVTETQVGQIIANLAAEFPQTAHPIDLPNPTSGGQWSKALRLSTQPTIGKDAIMIIGGVHGAEWGSCEIALNLATMLLHAEHLGAGLGFGGALDANGKQLGGAAFTAGQIAALFSSRDILIFPLVNPDGREYSRVRAGQADADWRKNRRPIVEGGVVKGVGVDINRNFDFVFDLGLFAPGSGPVASSDPTNPYYQGSEPLCEAETKNVVSLLDDHPVGWMVDLHSAGLSICYSWNHDDIQLTNAGMNFRALRSRGRMGSPGPNYREFLAKADLSRMKQLAQRFVDDAGAVRQSQFDPRPAYWNSAYPGTSHDYAYARHLVDSSKSKVFGFVCEWGDLNCQPPWSEMELIIEEVTAGLIGFCIETL